MRCTDCIRQFSKDKINKEMVKEENGKRVVAVRRRRRS